MTATKPISIWIFCLMLAGQICGSQTILAQARQQWSNLSSVPPGRTVTVHLQNAETKVKGKLSSVNEHSVTVLLKDGNAQVIARDEVRKLSASRGKVSAEVLIGAGLGASVTAVKVGQEDDFTKSGRAAFILAGAGLGALVGYIVHVVRGPKVIYEAP